MFHSKSLLTMNTFLKNTAILAVGLLSVLSSCSGDFLDNKPTDAVDSGIVPVPSNAGRIFNGAWYNLFEYSSTYANIGYRALMLQDDMMAYALQERGDRPSAERHARYRSYPPEGRAFGL